MKSLAIIIPLIGRYEQLIDSYKTIIEAVEKVQNKIEIIFVSDGDEWTFSPQYQLSSVILSDSKFAKLKSSTNTMATLLNKGIEAVEAPFFTVVTLKSVDKVNKIEEILNKIDNNQLLEDHVYYYLRGGKTLNDYPTNQVNYGQLQAKKIYQVDELIMPTKIARKYRFDETALMQNLYDWSYTLKLSKDFDFYAVEGVQLDYVNLDKYPYEEKINIPKDLAHRMVISSTHVLDENNRNFIDLEGFLNDLPLRDNKIIRKYWNDKKCSYTKKRPYKVTILGGLWEYHHNQLCFFNYFDRMFGQGFATYKVGLDHEVDERFVEDSDLVIFTRTRTNNSVYLAEFCRDNGIASMYLIDDNWISIGKDYPEMYGDFFCEGNPNYDNFIKLMAICNETWCYNELLEEDIKPYANKTFRFKVNVEHLLYSRKEKKSDNKIIIGYAGSVRQSNEAFEAMIKIAQKYKQVKLMIFGFLNAEQQELFKNIDIIRMDFVPYIRYAKAISEVGPDILLAQLDDTRTSQSKCFNKYLESGVLGAAGIYTRIKPYTDVVEDGYNGFFVDDNSVGAWYEKIEKVLKNIEMLRFVQKNSFEHILNNHSTEVMLEEFSKEINRIIEENIHD